MQDLLNSFIEIIGQQNDLLEQILKLSEDKRQAIVLGQVQELDSMVHKEGILGQELEKLESARFVLQMGIAEKLDIPVMELTAGEIRRLTNEQYSPLSAALSEHLNNLERLISKLRNSIQENNELLKMSLDYIDEMYYLLSPEDDPGVYSDKGAADVPGKRLQLIDKKA
ncbi:MAG: flagellar protein FlgN [Syntrophomonadaceae bacterium]|jgi:flagellar biosynthesis/type III secretory pathway chaperone